MPNLKEVKARISSVENTQQITNAMKLVAAAKLRKAQEAITRIRPYSQKMREILSNVAANVDESTINNVYSQERERNRILIVLMTSDRGLCGAFNSNITKKVKSIVADRYAEQEAAGQVEYLGIGKRGFESFQKAGKKVNGDYVDLFKELNFMEVRKAASYAIHGFTSGSFDEVVLVYNSFKNVATQLVTDEIFLPVQSADVETEAQSNTDYIFEPSVDFIIEDLIPKSLNIQFYKALLESNASEHGARMTAMDNATENAGELLKELNLTYNRTRQAAITKEILEIVGGANALQGGN